MHNMTQLTHCILVTSLLFAPTILAKETALSDKVVACSQISENSLRLNCFDALTDKASLTLAVANQSVATTSKPALVAPVAVTSVAVAQKPVASKKLSLSSQQIDAFGKEHVEKTNEELAKEINTINLTIKKLSKTVYGQWKITFNNGQKWQQKDDVQLKLKKGEKVILSKGAFSAVFLQKETTNKRIKVKRLK